MSPIPTADLPPKPPAIVREMKEIAGYLTGCPNNYGERGDELVVEGIGNNRAVLRGFEFNKLSASEKTALDSPESTAYSAASFGSPRGRKLAGVRADFYGDDGLLETSIFDLFVCNARGSDRGELLDPTMLGEVDGVLDGYDRIDGPIVSRREPWKPVFDAVMSRAHNTTPPITPEKSAKGRAMRLLDVYRPQHR